MLKHRQTQGYIDLSKRRVSSEDAKKCEDKYNKGKQVHPYPSDFQSQRQIVLSCTVRYHQIYVHGFLALLQAFSACLFVQYSRSTAFCAMLPSRRRLCVLQHTHSRLPRSLSIGWIQDFEDLCTKTAWKLEAHFNSPQGSAYDYFKLAISYASRIHISFDP